MSIQAKTSPNYIFNLTLFSVPFFFTRLLSVCVALSVWLDEPNGEPEGAVLAFAEAGPKLISLVKLSLTFIGHEFGAGVGSPWSGLGDHIPSNS